MAPPAADETRAEREERDHLVRKSQKPFPDLSVAVPNLRRTAGLPIWALADRSGLDADLLRRVEANRSRLTPDQFLRVAETCGAGDRADEWRRWAAECPWDFAVADDVVRTAYVVVTIVDRELHDVVIEHDPRDAVDVANDMLRAHVEDLEDDEDSGYVAALDEAVRLAGLGLEPDEFPPELQVATTDNLEAWSNMGDTHFDAHIFAIDV